MGRDSDPAIRQALLEHIFQYLLEHGLQDLSLRPLAKAIGTNARMLIYHFGSKEQMIVETLEFAQTIQLQALAQTPAPKASAEAELWHLWQWFTNDEFIPFIKLLFQVEAQALNGNTLYLSFAQRTLDGWRQFIQNRFDHCDAATANLITSTITGLLIDKVLHEDETRLNATFEVFIQSILPSLKG